MPRKRTVLPPDVEAEIAARTLRGEAAQTIHDAIGKVISTATIERRQREIRGGRARTPPTTRTASEPEDVPEVIPEGAPLEVYDRWLARLETGARKAETDGNLAALSSISMRVSSLLDARRKAAPLPKPDPADNPDMRALAEQGEKRLLALVNELFAYTQ